MNHGEVLENLYEVFVKGIQNNSAVEFFMIFPFD